MKILFVVGPTRSGSTLLSRVLNEFAGVVSVGEVISLDLAFQSCRAQQLGRTSAHGFVSNDDADTAAHRFSGLCGCLRPLTDCSVWSAADRAAFGDPPDYSRWSWAAERPGLTAFARKGAERWLNNDREALARVAESIYTELARVTGARVLVDESKSPLFGYFLCAQPWADVSPVRLVRDPRETAASWSQPKPYPGMLGGHFPTHPAHVSAINWLKRVVLADRLFKESGSVVRFEDFIEDPVGVASQLLAGIGIDTAAPPTLEHGMNFGVNHIIAGNPDKFERGEVETRRTNIHASRLTRRSAAIVTGMTLPLLRRYRYPISL
jgi:Sulfotransferase family